MLISQLKLIKNYFYKATCLLIIIIYSICFTACSNSNTNTTQNVVASKPHNIGNTIDNLNNYGYVAQDDKNVYYIIFEGKKSYLYKSDFNGNNKKIISETKCAFLNVVDNWIYYINYDDENKIYKMDTNGHNAKKINDIIATFLFVYEDKLYVKGNKDKYNNMLYSMKNDGSNYHAISNEKISQIYYYDGYFYFTNYEPKDKLHYLSKMDSEGKNIERVFDFYYGLDWFLVYKDNIYYSDSGNLNKISTIGKDKKQIGKATDFISKTINIYNNTLYCIEFAPSFFGAMPFHKINLENGIDNVKKIYFKDRNAGGMTNFLVNNIIYHYENDKLYIMNLDGNNIKQIH